ncbi:hypothetical protein OG896_01870 [Streptomyces sp. NBC_00669]|uniref:hypothetical protein n=1 Tax=Streptomyces sp. NBC_00669 TaxID=2976011 RepID=UPI002E35859F|nr:hypothetical protein [Streptomyces sp. NBC_00669]
MSSHRKITQNRRRMYTIAVGTVLAAAATVGVASAAPAHHAAPVSGAKRVTTTGVKAASVAGAKRVTTTGVKAAPVAGAKRVIPSVGDPAGAVRPWELTPAQRASAVG